MKKRYRIFFGRIPGERDLVLGPTDSWYFLLDVAGFVYVYQEKGEWIIITNA